MTGESVRGSGALRFRLLGPLDVHRDGQPLRLAGERQRALLALLLIHANEVVSTDRLVEQLFAGQSSESSANAVQAAVSRLRRLIEPEAGRDGAEVLVTRPPGYMLRASPDDLDVALFERLLAAGRAALAAGHPAAAVAKLREALSLWRGPALADLALMDFAAPEIRRLEELRLAAVMERIEAELALGAGAELVAELKALVEANPLQERPRGQLMLALYRAGRQADALAVYRQTRELLSDELGLEPSRGLQDLERSILRQEPSLEGPTAPRPPEPARHEGVMVCPFKGLAHFEAGDVEYFFGRERVIADLVTRLAGGSLVGIVGASGAGKSSLLHAGLLPALAAGALPGSERWAVRVIRPGEHPAAALSHALERQPSVDKLVVAVDQLEEVFTICTDESERAGFFERIVALADDPERGVIMALSVRADFYVSCAAYPRFAEVFSRNHVLVGPMERDELTRAIELPAARAGLQVERDLVDALVGDVAGEPGGLPLLSTMLLELWRLRDDKVLRLQTYRLSGGVRGAVGRLAEETYAQFDPAQQRAVRRIMLRLSTGDLATVARRRLPLAVLERVEDAGEVLPALVAARLLTASAGEVEVAHEALLHEWPRFRGWLEEDEAGRRLHDHLVASAREWEQRGRDPGDLYRGARLAATLDWAASHDAELIGPEREFVAASRERAASEAVKQQRLNRRLRGFLLGTIALLCIAVAAGAVALVKQRDAQAASRRALARQLGAEAVIEPRIDLAMLLAREAVRLDSSQQTESALLATLARSPAAIASFELPIGVRPLELTLSPDGRTVLLAANDSALYFYDTSTHLQQRPPLQNVSSDPAPAYSAGGALLAVALNGSRPRIEVFAARTLRPVATVPLDRRWLTVPTSDNPAQSLFLSPDGTSLYYAYAIENRSGEDGPAYLDRWALPSGKLLSSVALGLDGLRGIHLLGGGRRLEVVGDRMAVLLAIPTLSRLRSVRVRPPEQADVAISPDGTGAAFGTPSGSVSFVDLRTGRIRRGGAGHAGTVVRVSYSPDGRVLVSTGEDYKVIVWDPRTAHPIEVLTGHAGRPLGVAFSAESQTLFTCALDGTVIEWDLGSARRFGREFTAGAGFALGPLPGMLGTPPLALAPDGDAFAVRAAPSTVSIVSTRTLRPVASFTPGAVTALAWSPRGGMLAVGGRGGRVTLWSTSGTPRLVRRLAGLEVRAGQPEAVQSLAFAGNGRMLAASDLIGGGPTPPVGRVAVWNTLAGTLLPAPIPLGSPGNGVAFSPDRRRLAVAVADGRVLLIDPATGRMLRTIRPLEGADGGAVSVAFAPDGSLATGTWAGIVQFWNPVSGVTVGHPVLVASAPVSSIAFAPGGGRFATSGGSDGTLKLWFTSTLQQEGPSLDNEGGTWGNAVFTPDGRWLVAIHSDGHGFLWPVSLGDWESHACAVAGRNMTREEWSRFVAGLSYRPICG